MATTIKQKMKLDAQKKHSVLFKPAEEVEKPVVTGLYLMKHAYVGLGSPNEITLVVEATE